MDAIKKMEAESKEVRIQKTEGKQPEVVKETPFVIINTNKGYCIVVGREMATSKVFKTKEEAIGYIWRKPWDLIFAAMFHAIQIFTDKEREEIYQKLVKQTRQQQMEVEENENKQKENK